MFDHYIVTRFNLRREDWTHNKRQQVVLTDLWLKNRFELFTNFCFSSVAAQTNKNFTWLVYFDVNTPETYKEKIKDLENASAQFRPVFVDGMTQFLPDLQSKLAASPKEYVITSGLDNDDCLSIHFVNEVQKQFNKQDYLALDFIDGYTLQITPQVRVGYKLQKFNPFISLIEKNENPKGMYYRKHMHWKYETKLKTIGDCRIWSSIIHEENMINEFTGFSKVDINYFLTHFKLSKQKQEFILANNVPQNKWFITSFRNYLDSYFKYYNKILKRKLGLYKEK
ncbi:hypothetical protein PW52_12605 [Tamlana sedimentorum]|uniref:Rhamnosyl transferase n=1 Tax=Neotamlana sedimentorum TaxID=1435349 RepID=A0A0D7W7F2_9FLAO|nr:glycosyltransferase [Tamlana sedimentorum]KJD34939.1 hypothetical protein PW52_12605 [Tamlana sedimentorum]